VESAPINNIDPFGLEGVGPQHSYQYNFDNGQRHAQFVRDQYAILDRWRLWGHQNFPGETSSAMRHCTVSCVTAGRLGTGTARIAGVGNEITGFVRWDIGMLPSRLRGDTQWAFQLDDLSNNERGFDMSVGTDCRASDGDLAKECARRCQQLISEPPFH